MGNGIAADDDVESTGINDKAATRNGADNPSKAAIRTDGDLSDAIHPKYFRYVSTKNISGRINDILDNDRRQSLRIRSLASRYR